jgi:hypothetical protein
VSAGDRDAGEVLDLGVVGESSAPSGEELPTSAPVSRRALLAAGLVVAGAVGVEASRGLGSGRSSSSSTLSAARPAVQITHLPHPWPGGAGDWDLFALGDGVLLRVHPASGRVTLTQVQPVGEGQVSLVPVRGRVLIRPLGDDVPGVVVPDGGRPVAMSPSLGGIGVVLPGADQDHVWIEAAEGEMAVVTLDGRLAGVTVPVPEFATTGPMTDGAGGLLFEGVGGLYQVSPRGRLQVTNAILLAVGPGAMLTLEHDARARWHTRLRSRATVRTIPVPIGPQLPHGVLAPDARSVVLYVLHQPDQVNLAVVDLDAAIPEARRVHELSASVGAGEGTVVWTPDSRALVSLDAAGRLTHIDAATWQVTLLAPDLPAVSQLAVRPAS